MAVLDFNWNPSRRELRTFGLLLVAFSCLVGWWVHKARGDWNVSAIIVGATAVIAAIGWFVPALLRGIYVGWMVAAFPIGWVVSHLILGTIFYLVVTPLGLMMRMCGWDSLHRRFDRSASTYWIPREPPRDSARYFRQF